MNRRDVIYLDHNATTPVLPEVVEAMKPFFAEAWGNASSVHRLGRAVRGPMQAARESVAALVGAEPREVVFTSGGTESIHAMLHSALLTDPRRRHLITTAVEHSATLRGCARAQAHYGATLTVVPVTREGALELGALEEALRPDTALVMAMWANNETGVLFPLAEVVALCRARGVLCGTDAVQMAGKLPIDVRSVGVDFLALSAHKLGAPKGIGALYLRAGTPFEPLLAGGGQERGRRAGTENVPYIVGFGRAAAWACAGLAERGARLRRLRDRFEAAVLGLVPGTRRNGAAEPRLPNTTSLTFEGVEAEALLLELDRAGICAASGSACLSGSVEPSHVLTAMGLSPAQARGGVRFSFGADTLEADLEAVLECLPDAVARLRAAGPAPGG